MQTIPRRKDPIMLLPTDAELLTDLAGPLAYWGPATRQHTPRTAHPRRVASGRTPLQVAAQACLDAAAPRLHLARTLSRRPAGWLWLVRAA
jgi:hypothetical protein